MKSAMITKIILRSRLQSRTRKGRRGVMWMNKTHMICVVVSNQSRRRHLRWSSNWGREEGGSGGVTMAGIVPMEEKRVVVEVARWKIKFGRVRNDKDSTVLEGVQG
jgi:hypothetical protein